MICNKNKLNKKYELLLKANIICTAVTSYGQGGPGPPQRFLKIEV
jgi:hypothetical protein